MTRSGIDAAEFARHADTLLSRIETDVAEALRLRPLQTLIDIYELTVHPLRTADTGSCGVAGRYHESEGRVEYDATAVAGRQTFTLLHELCHHLAYQDDSVATFLEGLALEEAEEDLCDAFAAALILPADLVGHHIGPAGPTAAAVRELHDASTASREACAVAAAQRLTSSGYVVIAATDGTVQFAARSRTPYRIARATPQPETILAEAGRHGQARSDAATLRYRSGHPTDPYAADALRDGDYVFAVLTRGRPAWAGGLWIPPVERPASEEVVCGDPACGHAWTAWGRPCPACGEHRCPECQRCGCNRSRPEVEVTCVSCGLLVPAHRVSAGLCTDCA
jgi:Zn-dependent peptidase ImmA (M78 family)